MNRWIYCAVVIGVGFALGVMGGQPAYADESLRSGVAAQVQPYLDQNVVMGVCVGILQQQESTCFGFGRLSQQDTQAPDERTLFEIASVSKVMTGLLLADAVVQGRVRLDQPAADLLPKSVKMPSHKTRAFFV